MSAPVKQWVQSLQLRAIQVPSDRAKDGKRRLGATHFRVLHHLADRARNNGLAWPGMADIARAAEIGDPERPDTRRARRIVRDLELAGLIKSEQFRGRVKASEYASNEYWVRVPWVEEPSRVTALPKLANDEIPGTARVKELKGGRIEIDVDYYIRQSKIRSLNGAPEPYLDRDDAGKSGAGDTLDTSKSGAGDTPNRAPVASLNRAPAPAKPGNSGEPVNEAANSLNLSARDDREKNGHHDQMGELSARCPDCRREVSNEGLGHARDCRALGRRGQVERCPDPVCKEWVDESPRSWEWHTKRCRLRETAPAPSQWTTLDQVAAPTQAGPQAVEAPADPMTTPTPGRRGEERGVA